MMVIPADPGGKKSLVAILEIGKIAPLRLQTPPQRLKENGESLSL